MQHPLIVVAPLWVPHALTAAYVKAMSLVALGLGFLSKLGLHAPYIIDYTSGPNGAIGTCCVPIDDYLEIVEARESHTTAGTDGGNVTLTIEKLTGTQAPAGGANMLKTSTFNLKATLNTVQTIKRSSLTGLSAAQQAATQLAPGDRLSFTFAGTLTALVGVGAIVVLRRIRPAASSVR